MSAFATAQEVLNRLIARDLIDVQGAPTQTPDHDLVGGKAWAYSDINPDDDLVNGYFVEVHAWPAGTQPAFMEAVFDSAVEDESTLLFFDGANWALTLRRGRRDAVIPADIDLQILAALGEGSVQWARAIPEPDWFEPRFSDATSILEALADADLAISEEPLELLESKATAGPYIDESLEDESFASAVLQVPKAPHMLEVHAFVENAEAADMGELLAGYFPVNHPHALVTGDGWLVRIVDVASRVGADRLEGARSEIEAAFAPRVADGRILGPQYIRVTQLLGSLDSVSFEDAIELELFQPAKPNAERDEARRRASQIAEQYGLDDARVMLQELTGPDAPSPHWYAAERQSVSGDSAILHTGFSLLFNAQCAALALLVRHTLDLPEGLSSADYQALVAPWHHVIGAVHPRDNF